MGNIEKRTLIRAEMLDHSQYTVSLVKAGFRTGLLDPHEAEGIQMEIALILRELILQYTKGEGTSVPLETAERILYSVYYSMDARLRSIDNPEEALALLKEEGARKMYEQGVALVAVCLQETRDLYRNLRKIRLEIPLEAYQATVTEALASSFAKYGVVFSAQDATASIDYPLALDDMTQTGVFYMRQYIEKLKTETEFCNLYKQEAIMELLLSYGRVYGTDSMKLLINLFELVLHNAVFSLLSGGSADRLDISCSRSGLLQEKLVPFSPAQRECLVDEAFDRLIKELKLEETKMAEYIRLYRTRFLSQLETAIRHNGLQKMILTEPEEENTGEGMFFKEGERMGDDRFRATVCRMLKCRRTADKVNLLLSGIQSSEDFIDMLEADCMFGEEFTALYGQLGDMELSVLGRSVFHAELRNDPLGSLPAMMEEQEPEKEWQEYYIRYLRSLGQERLRFVGKMMHEVRLEYEFE